MSGGYFALSANTVQVIVNDKHAGRIVEIRSDSTTMTRISNTAEALGNTGSGILLTAYAPLTLIVPPGGELYAISTGTPNISVHDEGKPL